VGILIDMPFLDHFSFTSSPTSGPAAFAALAILATALLALPRRPPARAPVAAGRRLGLPKGVTRWLVIGGLSLAALLALGIDLQGLWSTLVAALSLVAIGFVAMWSILSHMLASILIVIFRPFEVGDRVEIVGDDVVLGEVTDLNPVYTTLRAEDGGTLQVPNNLFFQKALKRHALRPARAEA
jgi:small-conductance mechanosensitive channel